MERVSSSEIMKVMDAVFAVARPFRLGPHLRKKRFAMVSKYARGKVLDIGCGLGEMAGYLQEESQFEYTGIDNNKDVVAKGKVKKPSLMLYAVDIDTQDLPAKLSGCTFDTVTFVAVMEHLKNPLSVIKRTSEKMNSNSRLIITVATPTGERIFNLLAIFGFTNRSAIAEHESASKASWSFHELCELVLPFGYEVEVNKKFEFGLNQIVVFKRVLSPG